MVNKSDEFKAHMFKPGQSGNPLGGQKHDQVKRSLKKLTSKEVEEVFQLILENNMDGIKEIATNPKSSVLKVWVASIAFNAIKTGDSSALNALLERVVGKVKDKMEITAGPKDYTDEDPLVLKEKLNEKLKRLALLDE